MLVQILAKREYHYLEWIHFLISDHSLLPPRVMSSDWTSSQLLGNISTDFSDLDIPHTEFDANLNSLAIKVQPTL